MQVVAAGGTATFTATISAPLSNISNVYLNGDAFNVTGTAGTDDRDYFVDFPIDLTPGQSVTSPIFTVTLNPLTMAPASGSFSILGGSSVFVYNTEAIHKTLRVTPAMEAGIAGHAWSVEELVAILPEPVAKKRGTFKPQQKWSGLRVALLLQ